MRNMKRLAAALATTAVLGLAGCAAPPSMESDAAIHKVAILTVLDESGQVNKIGLTVFQNDVLAIPQEGNVSRTAVEAITQRLHQSRPDWQMVPAGVDLVALGEKYKGGISSFGDTEGKLRPELNDILKRLDADAVFLVTDFNVTNGTAIGPGVGVTLRKLPGIDAHVIVHAHVVIELLDKSGAVLHRWGGGETGLLKASDFGVTGDIASTNTPDARVKLSEAMRAELRRDVDNALQHMGY
jgi:hypothetical protein